MVCSVTKASKEIQLTYGKCVCKGFSSCLFQTTTTSTSFFSHHLISMCVFFCFLSFSLFSLNFPQSIHSSHLILIDSNLIFLLIIWIQFILIVIFTSSFSELFLWFLSTFSSSFFRFSVQSSNEMLSILL